MVANERGGIFSDSSELRMYPEFEFRHNALVPLGTIPQTFPQALFLRRESLTEAELGELYSRNAEQPFTLEEHHRYNLGLGEEGDWLLFIPHWLILLAVALPWLAVLFRRARRRKTAPV